MRESRVRLRNTSEQTLTLFIEPWCEQYDIQPGVEVVVKCELRSDDSAEIDVGKDNWISVATDGDYEISQDGIVRMALNDERVGQPA